MSPYSRVYAEIDMDAVRANFYAMRDVLQPGTRMLAVVKTDGYGHGAVPIAQDIEPEDFIWGFAVATVQEALLLRRSGIRKPILILGYTFEEDYADLVREKIRPVVFERRMAEQLSRTAGDLGETLPIHIGLDTGMSRIGFADTAESVREIAAIRRLPHLSIEGLFTHFARADEADKESTRQQFARYEAFTKRLSDAGIFIPLRHAANSAALIDLPQTHLDLVRAGISIYGIYPSDEVDRARVRLTPAMSWHSHIVMVKDILPGTAVSYGGTFVAAHPMRIATIPVGYGDGYPRLLSNKGSVLICGKRAPILGRVCMDQFMVDVTHIPQARQLDPVVLLGEQGGERITVEELGALSGRFPYEFVCDVGRRVPRRYKKNGVIYQTRDLLSGD